MHLPDYRGRRALASLVVISALTLGLLSLPACTDESKTSSSVEMNEPAPTPSLGDTTVETDVPFVVTPQETVEGMLELAEVTEDDVVYDLGSGDGRIPITAAEKYGARGVGIELKPDLVERARKRAKRSGVSDKVEFRRQDIFEADFSEATVVTMYLFPEVNLKLRPMLFEQLQPGSRVVSHSFNMDEWEPDSSVSVNNDILYLWTIPENTPDFIESSQ